MLSSLFTSGNVSARSVPRVLVEELIDDGVAGGPFSFQPEAWDEMLGACLHPSVL